MNGRPDLDTFVVGDLYNHDDTDEIVEFIGEANIPELAGEDVAAFRFAEAQGACLVATQKSFNQGDTFTPVGDAAVDDLDLG